MAVPVSKLRVLLTRTSKLVHRNLNTFVKDNEEAVVITDDGSTIVCWHPEKPFPYEFSAPLPVTKKQTSTSVLKVFDKEEAYKIFKNKGEEFVRQELMKITFTTKHQWFPRARDKKAKKTPPDRPYI